ncbi:MAG: archaeosortase A [Candidatus Poseidoniaceae archaeon]|nr:archaeosortase A [Candidatus Poseidoniaceae archaeon]
MMVSPIVSTLLAGGGLLCLGWGFHSRSDSRGLVAAAGWVLMGAHFTSTIESYIAIWDTVLIIMTGAALPVGIALARWEMNGYSSGEDEDALVWFRGMVLWAGLPYMLIDRVPWLNVLAIWFVAWQTILFMRWSGGGDIQLGETTVSLADGSEVAWADWEGNRWFMFEPISEHTFHTELLNASGESLGINFVLACTALQSMIIFVGAVVALKAPWKRRVRALLVTIPTIHILNVFRNAGIVWLHGAYPGWEWLGLDMFQFAHAYLAKFVSLGAMFLMALILFELLPVMHQHVLRLMQPIIGPKKKLQTTS